jgi:hypothetical protein
MRRREFIAVFDSAPATSALATHGADMISLPTAAVRAARV